MSLAVFPHHEASLKESGVPGDIARARGYVSVDTKARLASLGFAPAQQVTPGLLVPLYDTSGHLCGYQYRPDEPREVEDRVVKYESLPGSQPTLDVNPMGVRWLRGREPLWITEGSKKVDSLTGLGVPAVGLLGVSSWMSGGVALGQWRDVSLRDREVIIAFDSDVMTKESVRGQLDALATYLAGRGAKVHRLDLPQPDSVDSMNSMKLGKVGVDDYVGAGGTLHELRKLVSPYKQDRPVPLHKVGVLPPFPVDVLPGWLANHVAAVAEATQTDPALAGCIALGVLAAGAGGRVEVEVRSGWREPTCLFLLPASAPGTRKSGVFSRMTAPLVEAERALVERMRASVMEAEITKDVAVRAAETLRRKAATADDKAAALAEAIDAAAKAEAIDVPTVPRLIADDATPETIGTLLAEGGGRLAIMSAEGGIFDIVAGRYSNGVANLEPLLKGHAGDTIRIDRRGRQEYVERPALTMAVTVQPSVLRQIGGNRVMGGRGLLARFLYALPENLVGRRKVNAEPVPEGVAELYSTAVQRVVTSFAGLRDVTVVTLGSEATAVLQAHETALEPRLGPDGDLAGIVEWGSKLAGATARLAALLHLAAVGPDNAGCLQVGEDTARAAVALADYFTVHALAAFGLMGSDTGTDDAQTVLRFIAQQGMATFTLQSLHARIGTSRFPKAELLASALDVLESHGWVHHVPAPYTPGKRGRKPSPAYVTHSEAFTEFTEFTESREDVPA